MQESAESQWRHRAAHAARLANFGWWLDCFLPVWVGASVCLAVALLILRRQQEPTSLPWALYAVILIGGAWIVRQQARGRFRSPEQSLSELDAFYRLDNRLSAAAAGIGPWPPPQHEFTPPLAVRWPRLAGNAIVPLILIAVAALIPIGQYSFLRPSPSELPPSLAQIKDTLNRIEEKKVADPVALAEAQKALAQLSQASPENWYKQSTLEAAQNLRDQTGNSLRAMDQQLTEARNALRAMKENPTAGGSSAALARQQRLTNALSGLKTLPLGIDPKLASQLEDLAGQDMSQLTKEQLSDLEKALADLQDRDRQSLEEARIGENGPNGKEGKGRPGSGPPKPGQGPPAETPDSQPLALRDDNVAPGDSKLKTVASQDKQAALPGDRLGESDHKPQVDTQAAPSTTSAGPTNLKVDGGDPVWQSSFTPDEQEILIRFFR